LFLGKDSEFNKRDFFESINERWNDSVKKIYGAISKRITTNTEKTKTDGKLNFEMVTTKAVMTKPQMEQEKKQMHSIKDKERLKKENKGGEKTNSSNDKFDFVNKKAVQKTNSSDDDFEEYKLASSDDDFEENKSAYGNENEHIEEVMNQKGIGLRSSIKKPLSDEDSNKFNQIIKNKEAKPGEIYIHYGNKYVSWNSMRRILNLDTTEIQSKRWMKDKVIDFYFKKYLAEMDQK
jgi:hypothetical protein